jgi:hypothetical protein
MTRRHARQAAIGAVFSDPTGRRRKRMQRIGYIAGGGCVVYMGLLGVSLTGGPISPEQLLPPGVPDKIERLLDPDSAQAQSDDVSSVGNDRSTQPLAVPGYDSGPRIPGHTPGASPSSTGGAGPVPGSSGGVQVPGSPPAPQVPAPEPPAPVAPPAPVEPPPAPEAPSPVEPPPAPEAPVPVPEEPTGGVDVPLPDLSPEVPSVPDVLPSLPGTSG